MRHPGPSPQRVGFARIPSRTSPHVISGCTDMGVLDSPPDALDEALLRMLSTALDGSASGHSGRHFISACITEQPKRSVSIVAQSMPARP